MWKWDIQNGHSREKNTEARNYLFDHLANIVDNFDRWNPEDLFYVMYNLLGLYTSSYKKRLTVELQFCESLYFFYSKIICKHVQNRDAVIFVNGIQCYI